MDNTQIIGQSVLRKRLKDALEGGRPLHHAFLFNAADGMGKKTIAYDFAKDILCLNNKSQVNKASEELSSGKACGHCDACRYFAAGTHPDFKHITRGKEKSIKVEVVRRDIISDIQVRPQISDFKVYLLNLDDLSEQSQNALLKSLEEPPASVVFLLTTSLTDNLLETILSRVNTYNLQKYSVSEMQRILSQNGQSDDLDFVISYAEGNPGLAMRLLADEGFKDNRQKAIDIFFSMPTASRTYLLTTVLKDLVAMKDQIDLFLNIWQDLLHDLLILYSDPNITKINQMLIFDRIKRLADYYISETSHRLAGPNATIDPEDPGISNFNNDSMVLLGQNATIDPEDPGVLIKKDFDSARFAQLTHSFEALSEIRKANQVNVNPENALGQLLLTLRKDLHIDGRSN